MSGIKTIPTSRGARLLQHGTLLSEVLRSPGPTHSVVDFMAASVKALAPGPRVAMLGFAGGGILAPLRALGATHAIDAVDMSEEGYAVFQTLCGAWSGGLHFHLAEAGQWLRAGGPQYDMILEDLSISRDADVIKPDLVWADLPGLMETRLSGDGLVLFNLLKPGGLTWKEAVSRVIRPFAQARLILLDDFENRLVLAGRKLPSAREVARRLRGELRRLGSRQQNRFSARTIATRPFGLG